MDLLTNARQLRKNSTDAERQLWQILRNRQLNGYKFKRQTPLGNYIVDFCCSSVKLIIEVDGGQHVEQENYDSTRAEYLESLGYKVIRFWNNDVLANIEDVLESVTSSVVEMSSGELGFGSPALLSSVCTNLIFLPCGARRWLILAISSSASIMSGSSSSSVSGYYICIP